MASIERLHLRRCLQMPKTNYSTLLKTMQEIRLTNVLQFGVLPAWICIYFNELKHIYGSYSKPFYCSSPFDVKYIKVYISGKPHFLNQQMSDLNITSNSPDLFYFYNLMCQFYGPNAHHESLSSFYKDSFVFMIPMSRSPLPKGYYGTDTDLRERNIQFGEAGSIEVEVGFHGKATEDRAIFVTGWFDVMVSLRDDWELREREFLRARDFESGVC